MTLEDYKNSLRQSVPPSGISIALKALWHDGRGEWDAAHHLVQDDTSAEGSWIHAYLHRKEGDRSNALYWYQRANRKMPASPIEQEWEDLVREFLNHE